ncbi:MAG TPA: hypothetical protein VF796_16850 [Humisphaera sp.]
MNMLANINRVRPRHVAFVGLLTMASFVATVGSRPLGQSANATPVAVSTVEASASVLTESQPVARIALAER